MTVDTRKKALAQLSAVASQAGISAPGQQLSAFAQVIVETIQPNHVGLNAVSGFLPVRTLQAGDRLEKRVRKSPWPIRTFVPGTTHLADQIAERDVVTIALQTLVAKVGYNLWELRRGELGTIDDFRREMESSMIDEFVSRAFAALTTVWTPYSHPITGSHFVDASSTGLTESVLGAAMEKVLKTAGVVRVIAGVRANFLNLYENMGIVEHTATGQSTPSVLGIESLLTEWKSMGKISTYRGTPIFELPQVYRRSMNNYDTPLIPEQYVLVIGDNAGEFILYGGTESQEYTDFSKEPPDYYLTLWRSYGMIIDAPENIVVIKVS